MLLKVHAVKGIVKKDIVSFDAPIGPSDIPGAVIDERARR